MRDCFLVNNDSAGSLNVLCVQQRINLHFKFGGSLNKKHNRGFVYISSSSYFSPWASLNSDHRKFRERTSVWNVNQETRRILEKESESWNTKMWSVSYLFFHNLANAITLWCISWGDRRFSSGSGGMDRLSFDHGHVRAVSLMRDDEVQTSRGV